MKLKYNFGLLKKQTIGFLNPETGYGYHGELVNVLKKGHSFRFIYEDRYLEISESVFTTCRFEKINDIYYFIPDGKINGLLVYSMYDTLGFPPELTREILEEKGLVVDMDGFQLIREIQRQKNKGTFKNPNAF